MDSTGLMLNVSEANLKIFEDMFDADGKNFYQIFPSLLKPLEEQNFQKIALAR